MKVDARAREINLGGGSDTTLFLIHGYTGSPTDFSDLPTYVHEEFGYRVRGLLLPGHGTVVNDLDRVTYSDMVGYVENELRGGDKKRKKVDYWGCVFRGVDGVAAGGEVPSQGSNKCVQSI
jgi:esterase/lipase